jgi:hypothetical protein
MVEATWALAAAALLTIIGGAIKLGMDLASVKKEIRPNGGDTDGLGDVVLQVRNLLEGHLRQNQELLDAIKELKK